MSEYLVKEVNISGGNCEYVHNARHLIDSLEEELPWSIRLNIIQQASMGLTYLHKKQIVQCDIKSGNIFIGGGNGCHYVAKIGDFGQFSFSQTSFPGSQTSKEGEKLKDFPRNKQDEWVRLMQSCWSQRPESRPSMDTVSELLSVFSSNQQKVNSIENVGQLLTDQLVLGIDIEDVALDVHQGTVAETAGDVAAWACENNVEMIHLQQDLENCIDKLDGTNACPFLAIKIADMFYSLF